LPKVNILGVSQGVEKGKISTSPLGNGVVASYTTHTPDLLVHACTGHPSMPLNWTQVSKMKLQIRFQKMLPRLSTKKKKKFC